jgi:TolB-like protein
MSDNGSRLREFVAELERRRVFRVAALYAIVVFVILQVAEIVLPALRVPEWGLTFVVAVSLLCFPVALVLAWYYDITRAGVVRTQPSQVVGLSGRSGRAIALTSVVLVVLATVSAGYYVLPRLPGWWSVDGEARATEADERTLLVVLPFVNLGSPIDEYFADGITEEITARLASLEGLGVIARTTAIQYKDSEKTAREIGDELGVDYVLEGTVRWESPADGTGRVRVTPQLIRVGDDTHVWAEIYEEPLESVFAVQTQIAERVVDALDVTIREPERLALQAQPTENIDAYRYYQLGNQLLKRSTSPAAAQQAIEMFELAVQIDPDFELARQKLAEIFANLYWANFRMLLFGSEEDHRRALDRLYLSSFGADSGSYYLAAGVLNERLGEGEAALAYFDSARALLERDVAAQPGAARFHAQLGLAYAGLGRDAEAVREGVEATRLTPLSADPYVGGALLDNLAHIYVLVGDYEAAVGALESLLARGEGPMSRSWLSVDPTWSPLRDTPAYQSLVESVD